MAASNASVIRPARLDEAATLHALTGRSALHWGYEPEFLARSITVVLEEHGQIIGYYALVGEPPVMSLDKLFVAPEWIGTGRGKRLWQHAVATARSLGATELTLAADPNAAPFYRAMGAIWEREEATTREGWNLQMFLFPLGPSDPRET